MQRVSDDVLSMLAGQTNQSDAVNWALKELIERRAAEKNATPCSFDGGKCGVGGYCDEHPNATPSGERRSGKERRVDVGITWAEYMKLGTNRRSYTVATDRRQAQPEQEPVALYVIFDGPPSHESGCFVEVETAKGKSVSVAWEQYPNESKLWRLGPFYTRPSPSTDTVLVPRAKLEHWAEYWNGSSNERAMSDALEHIIGEMYRAMPKASGKCPE